MFEGEAEFYENSGAFSLEENGRVARVGSGLERCACGGGGIEFIGKMKLGSGA